MTCHKDFESTPRLRPYHAFSRENAWYVINRDRFAYEKVPGSFIAFLESLRRHAVTEIPENHRERLKRLKLLRPTHIRQERIKPSPPVISDPPVASATVFITQKCNHRCLYCYGDEGEYGEPGVMDAETGFRTLEWLWAQKGYLKTVAVSFFGGEPLLNFGLIQEMVAHAHRLERGSDARFQFTLSSNGALLNDAVLDFMEAHDFYALIGFDGPREIQDRNRPLKNGGSSYDTVIPHIRKLISRRPNRVTLRGTIWQKGDIPSVVREMRDLNPTLFQTPVASPGGHSGSNTLKPTADWRDVVTAVDEAIPDFLRAVHERDTEAVRGFTRWLTFNPVLGVISRRHQRTGTCGVGRQIISVSSRGIIYPCHRFVGLRPYAIGNIVRGELNRGIYLNAPLLRSPVCNACWAKHLCNGGCIYDHLVRTGHRFTPDAGFCEMTKALFETGIHLDTLLSREEKEFLYEKQLVKRPFCPLDL